MKTRSSHSHIDLALLYNTGHGLASRGMPRVLWTGGATPDHATDSGTTTDAGAAANSTTGTDSTATDTNQGRTTPEVTMPEPTYDEVRAALDAAIAAGIQPTDERVRTLEQDLAGLRLAQIQSRMNNIRQINGGLSGGASRGASDPFTGFMFRNLQAARQAVRQLGIDPDTRAIDTSVLNNGGKLNADTADRFIDWVIAQQATLAHCQVRRMNANTANIDTLTLSRRRIRKGNESTEVTPGNAIGTKRRTLSVEEAVWAEDITRNFLEDNIEKENAESHITQLVATQFGTDLNDLAWNGNEAVTSGATDEDFLKQNDGWYAKIAAASGVTTVDATGITSPIVLFAKIWDALPMVFRALPDLAFHVNMKLAQAYANEIAARQTAQGDAALMNGIMNLSWMGVPVKPDPHNAGCVLTPYSNLVMGIQRDVTLDSEYRPRKRAVELTLTSKVDFNIAEVSALVLVINLHASLK